MWDSDGRLSEKREGTAEGVRVWRYRWDGAGLLSSVQTPDGKLVEFSYDPFGRRLEKKVVVRQGSNWKTETTTRFVWDQHVLACEIRRRAGETGDPIVSERSYLFRDGSSEPEAEYRTGDDTGASGKGWLHYVTDLAGAPANIVYDDGRVAARIGDDPWGREKDGEGDSTAIRFQGQYKDGETGLTYNRWRYYDSDSVSFLSPDPGSLNNVLNAYAYVPSTLLYIDPSGLQFGNVTFPKSALYQGPNGPCQVSIPMQGSRGRDFTQANIAAGLDSTPPGYTWHHVADFDGRSGKCTMQLVKTCDHEATYPHAGAVSQFEQKTGTKYGSSAALDVVEGKGRLVNPRR